MFNILAEQVCVSVRQKPCSARLTSLRSNQFKYKDSIKIIRKQVEKYEELLREHIEKIEMAKQNTQDAEILRDKVESLKMSK
ncbi:hypothetical protein FACS189426_20320 [Bacteroidia bacterium]|nr:hypothetical protein FACS189426_20320 [Bacteroidia bacterium]